MMTQSRPLNQGLAMPQVAKQCRMLSRHKTAHPPFAPDVVNPLRVSLVETISADPHEHGYTIGWQRLCEQVTAVHIGVDLVALQTLVASCVLEPQVLDLDMFRLSQSRFTY